MGYTFWDHNSSEDPVRDRAIFVGADGSLGLKHGSTYTVNVRTECSKIFIYWNGLDPRRSCAYDTITAMVANWSFIGR